ncbi:MAG: hypothetical protein EOR00_09065 [Mesorhizobium sp.]|uniref:hypothetical protein n=1 Tax=Mesorhizobium sp. TaxID=1871066 RepID=UPI000FE6A62D|nr:hypothetical protein [Mesorhizobium sp.]RWP19247.1 MAG: hypothetical protein EOR00_09065 [Mesorhizobium sp.]
MTSPWFSVEAVQPTEDDGFIIGDTVTLVTGSPDMVVVDVCECGSVDVVWYDEGGFNEASLPEEALVYA